MYFCLEILQLPLLHLSSTNYLVQKALPGPGKFTQKNSIHLFPFIRWGMHFPANGQDSPVSEHFVGTNIRRFLREKETLKNQTICQGN